MDEIMTIEKLNELVDKLISPFTKKKFKLRIRGNEVFIDDSENEFPVINGIPRIFKDFEDEKLELTSKSFGYEWSKFNNLLPDHEAIFQDYFDLVDASDIKGKVVLDAGCGMGRWTKFVLNYNPGELYCLDLSRAIDIAQDILDDTEKVFFIQGDIYNLPFEDNFFDFIYSLGVLHHLPDVEKGFKFLSSKLRRGGKLLVYIYYALDNRPYYFKFVLKIITFLRKFTTRLPHPILYMVSFLFAVIVYMPLIYLGKILKFIMNEKIANNIPLYEGYKNKAFKIIFNDSFDRLSAPIEKRFSKAELIRLYEDNGFKDIEVSSTLPYWKIIGTKT